MPERATSQARIDAGKCVYGCGSERDGAGLACTICARRHAEREAKRRADLRRDGICIQCGQAKPEPSLFRCRACLDSQAARVRQAKVQTKRGRDTPADMDYRTKLGSQDQR